MKLVIWGLILVLLVSFVSAELRVSCENDSQCYLINRDSSCVENYCYSNNNQRYMAIEDLQPRNNEFQWNIVNVEPKTARCESCLILAPAMNSWFDQLINWIFFVR